MWLAHLLTLSRLPIAIGLTQTYGNRWWSVGLIALAALTDTLDGNVARAMRRRGKTTPDIGGWLDPVVDKAFVVIVLATIWIHTHDLVLIGLVAAREILLVPYSIAYLARHRPVHGLQASTLGKAATVAQFIACGVAVAEPRAAWPVAVVAAMLGVAAVGEYTVKELRVRPGA